MGLNISSRSILIGIKEYFLMTVGMFCYAFGWLACVLPAGGQGGGAAGLATILNAVYDGGGILTIGTYSFIINVILLILGGFIVGWKFGIKTIFCIVMMSLMMNIVEFTIPREMMPTMLEKVDAGNLLLVVLGAASCGVGIAVAFMQGGSTGGTDIVAMIINKFRQVSYGRVLFMTDCGILIASLFIESSTYGMTTVTEMGVEVQKFGPIAVEPLSSYAFAKIVYGFIMIAVIGYTVDLVQSGNQQSNQILIFCKNYESMADMIFKKAHRGATLIETTGWYSKHPSKAVMVVCRKRDTTTILKLVKEEDPTAFITVGSVMGVYGQGFDALNKV